MTPTSSNSAARENPLTEIAPRDVIRSYDSLRLADWSDFDLFRAAAEIVSRPKQKFSSFALHAPLEIPARFCLLPLVTTQHKRLARIQIVAAAAVFQSLGPAVDDPRGENVEAGSPSEIVARLRQAIHDGDVPQSDLLFTALAERADPRTVIDSIADLSLQTLTGAAHTHIGLMLLARLRNQAVPEALKLLRAGVRFMAEAPGLKLKPTSGRGKLNDLEEALANVPKLPKPVSSVRGMVEATEGAGILNEILGDAFRPDSPEMDWEAAIRTACRIAALSMIADAPDAAKYGWTHCLTLPQAAWALARDSTDASFQTQAARSAVSWVASFRAALGNGALNTTPAIQPVTLQIADALRQSREAAVASAWHAAPEQREQLIGILASEAAIRIDAHLIKFTRACFDLVRMDPEQAPLYLAAAASLCALWCLEEPENAIVERLAMRPGL